MSSFAVISTGIFACGGRRSVPVGFSITTAGGWSMKLVSGWLPFSARKPSRLTRSSDQLTVSFETITCSKTFSLPILKSAIVSGSETRRSKFTREPSIALIAPTSPLETTSGCSPV